MPALPPRSQRDKANLASALKQVELLKAEIAQATAAALRANALQRQAELNLGYTTITAPIDGVVGNRTLRVGQYVQAGTQLMSVVPVQGAYVVANYKETQLTNVREGQAVDIEVDMFPGQIVHGHVDSIAPASGQEFALLPPDNATGNFTKVVQRIPVRIALDSNAQYPASNCGRACLSSRPLRRARRSAARRRPHPPAFTRPIPEHRAMSNQSPSASISALPTSPAASSSSTDPNRASVTTWIAVSAAMIGSFMAILNIQITNASLLNIEGGIGTGVDNGSWISTSYLIGEIVVIPLTDFLSRVFSFRRYMIASAALFAMFSVACAFTHDLPSMIAMRGLQGFAGGVLIPMAFTLVLTKLPKSQQPVGLAIFALSVTFAPAIGPTIGGYLTENYGWRTIFYVNVIPTAVMVTALYLTLERQPMQLKLLREGDWAGIFTMAIGLSALQTVLEEGNKDDWFASPFIQRLAVIAFVSLALFVWIELTAEKPLIRLRLLKSRNFGFGTIALTLVGFALFGSVYILPAYLGQAQGYNAEQIGNVLAWTGLPQLLLIPLLPILMKRFDTRYIAFTGLVIFAYSCFMNTAMSPDYAGDQLFIPNIVRAIGQAMVLTPLSSVTTGDLAPQDAAAASGISNMLRNLGGAIGTAVLATVITKREQFHSNIIGQSVTLGREEVRNRIAQTTDYFLAHGVSDPATAHKQAIVALGKAVKHQALVMGFSDTFAVIGVVLVLAALAVRVDAQGEGRGEWRALSDDSKQPPSTPAWPSLKVQLPS